MAVEMSAGTLYAINQNIMKTQDVLKKAQLEKKKKELKTFFMEKINSKYFMLLCKELSDYTIFVIPSNLKCEIAVNELEECLVNRGEILSINKTEDQAAFEIWIRKRDSSKDVHAYYLFPYSNGVIEC